MDVMQAVSESCESVGIATPDRWVEGKWVPTDAMDGRKGNGSGRVKVDGQWVTAFNWKIGAKKSINLRSGREMSISEIREMELAAKQRKVKDRQRAEYAAGIAREIMGASELKTHPYLSSKGLPGAMASVVPTSRIMEITGNAGRYLVPDHNCALIAVPALVGGKISSLQVIWPDGTKKFLAGGSMAGASHSLSRGRVTWLCEGLATGLTLSMALKSMNRDAGVTLSFSASNIGKVSRQIKGECMVCADNDAPQERFDGLGAGEYYARETGHRYIIPDEVRMDINDVYCKGGIYAVQRIIKNIC